MQIFQPEGDHQSISNANINKSVKINNNCYFIHILIISGMKEEFQ